jgi:malonyl-CoA/methylmalonyl-CoA synthetase
MAVPTVYYKLIQYWDQCVPDDQSRMSLSVRHFRLMVSGSAALPVTILEKWKSISGHTLLERYGMTEIGMALSNAYGGARIPGHVGLPLPGVELRIVDEQNRPVADGSPGEIQVKGPSVFKEYWRKETETKEAFTENGWFITGDVARLNKGYYQILGRNSVDIIKSGGYKISALTVEEVLRTYPSIQDCAVVGIANEEWGEVVSAALVLNAQEIDLEHLQQWIKERLPSYQVPRHYLVCDELPRKNIGKVTKNQVKKLLSDDQLKV